MQLKKCLSDNEKNECGLALKYAPYRDNRLINLSLVIGLSLLAASGLYLLTFLEKAARDFAGACTQA